MAMHPLVQAGEEIMEVQATLGRCRYSLEEAIEQPALAASDRAVQVQAACLACRERGQLRGHRRDHPALPVTQGVAALRRAILEVARKGTVRRWCVAQALAEQAQGRGNPGGQVAGSSGRIWGRAQLARRRAF